MQLGYIYKLTAPNTNKIYVGSTTNPTRRFKDHKHNPTSRSKIIMEYSGVKMDILETIEFNEIKELKKRESHHILQNLMNCVNRQRPLRTNTEYYQDNKLQINIRQNTPEICPICFKSYTKRNKARHYKIYCKPPNKERNLIILMLLIYFTLYNI
jgi:predicted GIY-YIG superfamily endonuclease